MEEATILLDSERNNSTTSLVDCCRNNQDPKKAKNNNDDDDDDDGRIQDDSNDSPAKFRVSFRDDVVFTSNNNNNTNKMDRNTIISSARSTSTSSNRTLSSGGDEGDASTSSSSSCGGTESTNSSSKYYYSKLRSNLTREQMDRNPFFFYQVTKNLGSGSMGDVQLVKKRADRIGGSARRDIQQAVRRQQREKECLNLPVLGNLFRFCMDGDLKDEGIVGGRHDVSSSSSHHSFISIFSNSSSSKRRTEDSTTTTASAATVSTSRSFEDSLLNESSSTSSSAATTTTSSDSQIIIYAMKSIHLDQVTKKEYIDELRNEIAILKDLDHPNIVRAIETFEWKGKISIVMELCSGGDLYTRDPYTEAEAARIIGYILSAISYMHSRNIVHRDLKFENVLFVNTSPMSEVKLIDFGLSKVYVDREQLTDVSGSIYTMAPEVLLGSHTEKADIWSIGVIAFMLLSSSLPFYGRKQSDVIQKILANNYVFKGRRWKRVSREAKAFIRDLLVSDPNERIDAECALRSAWLNLHLQSAANTTASRALRADEEEMARSSILRYAGYCKLKKMALMVVAHKSSNDEIGILRKMFTKYDSRHDGSIWFEDFCEAMSGCGLSNEELRSTFDAMDLDGSGRIRYTEFIASTIEAHGAISEVRLAEAFDRLDCSDAGFITAENLMEILGEDVPRDEIDAIIAEADLTNDSRVSYSDFMALWEDKQEPEKDESPKVLGSELSSLSLESDASKTEASDAHAEFLKEKHLQNTLHTWATEMQLPAQEFATGCSFLHQVALGNLSDLEKMLEERPTLVNFRDYDRRSPLHIAASEGHVDICKYLIKKGARVNRNDRWGGFPLDDAHRHRRSDVVILLREHGAKFGSTSQTVNLITAALEGNVEEVRTLLEFGSMDLNQGDYDHRTALHLAANEGHLEVVKLLCEAGADINVKDRWGDRPLDDARKAKKNATAIANILSGAVTVSSTDQQTAKMHDLKDQSVKQTTVSRVVDERNDEGMTQLPAQEFAMGCSVLHQAALGNQLVLEKILLEQPALVHFRDYDRRTSLHIAASEGQLDICRFLVAKGARVNRVDRWGGSPLDDAHRHRHADVVKFLREHGAKFGSTSQATNFITAASEGDREEVQAFLDFGSVDLNQGDYDRRTALHLAAGEGHLEIVSMLCKAGADVNVEDRWGHRPLDDAKNAKKNSPVIMKLLLKHGAKSAKISTKITAALLSVFVRG